MVQELTDQIQVPKTGDGKGAMASPLNDHKFALGVLKSQNGDKGGDAAMLQGFGFPKDVFSQKEAHQTPLDKQFRDREISRLSPKDQDKYKEETAAQKAHEIGTMHEKAPPSPIHDKVEEGVKKAEQQANQKALESMTPAQRDQLKQEQQKYDKQMDETYHHGHGKSPFAKDPVPGPTMEEYERRVRREANRDLTNNK